VEEIKEGSWFVNKLGNVESTKEYEMICVAEHLCFPTKEHAQAFADWLKYTFERPEKVCLNTLCDDDRFTINCEKALNSRIK
jgi:hypothetical protein